MMPLYILHIQFPVNFEERYNEYKSELLGSSKPAPREIENVSKSSEETPAKQGKNEHEIVLGKLKFNKISGDFVLGRVNGNFPPDTQEFKVVLKVLTSSYFQAKDSELLKEMYPDYQGEFGKYKKMQLQGLLKKIKRIMGILPRNKRKNDDIFHRLKSWKGYKIVES